MSATVEFYSICNWTSHSGERLKTQKADVTASPPNQQHGSNWKRWAGAAYAKVRRNAAGEGFISFFSNLCSGQIVPQPPRIFMEWQSQTRLAWRLEKSQCNLWFVIFPSTLFFFFFRVFVFMACTIRFTTRNCTSGGICVRMLRKVITLKSSSESSTFEAF